VSSTDRLIVVLGALLVAGLYATTWTAREPAEQVVVWVQGEERLTLPLDRELVEHVAGPAGVTTIEIRAGRVRVVDSPGAQQLCQRAGWLEQAGDAAVCLPNQIVVEVRGGQPRFDAINF
jgi:hypothetical protein